MPFLQIIGFAFITAFASLLLKGTKPELSVAVGIVGGILILLSAFDALKESFSVFYKIAELSSLNNAILKTLIKIIGIGYITEFSVGILQDFGSQSIADKVLFCGKIAIFALTVPVINKLFELILSFMSLV